uniref:Syntrophin C-terminal PH domain-containing protein n=1 Tax=Denticeps clupeoides TaxID=299321 RepID=A0AAY4C9E4_9TELE
FLKFLPIPPALPFKISCLKYRRMKAGLALLYDEDTNNTYDIRLKLSKEMLTIQKQDVVCSHANADCCFHPISMYEMSNYFLIPPLTFDLRFLPAADQSGMLFIGDAVLQVSGVHLLRTAGDEVTITVRYLREAPAFLKLPLGSPGPSSDQSSRASSPLFDSGLQLNGNSSNTAPSSPSSPSANEPKYEKRWLDAVSLSLSMARVSRYKAGSDKLRSNSFEVFALDVACTNVLQFSTAAESTDWLQAISTNINDLTLEIVRKANQYNSPDDQIVHMGWVCEHLQTSDAGQSYSYKYLALKGSSLYILRSPPNSASDWAQAEATFNLCEVLFKVHKLWIAEDCWIQMKLYPGLQQDCELRDSETFCFSVLVGHGHSHCFSVELGSELALWEKAFQRAVFSEVQRVGSKSYMCSCQGNILCFTIDFGSGFSCSESISKVSWYKFSQLKGSSDDGKTRVKLLFQNSENKQIEMKEMEFANLTAVLHCIHSFIAAKVASVDPVFVNNQSITRKHMCSS